MLNVVVLNAMAPLASPTNIRPGWEACQGRRSWLFCLVISDEEKRFKILTPDQGRNVQVRQEVQRYRQGQEGLHHRHRSDQKHERKLDRLFTYLHRDKARVQMPAKMFLHLKLLCLLFMGPTLGFDTKQRNSFLIKFGVFSQ